MKDLIHAKITLMNYPKEELVDHCIDLEHNIKALKEQFEVQYKNCMQLIADMNLVNDILKKARG